MSKKRKKRRRNRDEEQLILSSRSKENEQDDKAAKMRLPGAMLNGVPERPLSPQQITQAQQHYGNAYVQRLMSQQQIKDEEAQNKRADNMDKLREFTFEPVVRLRQGGYLEIDMKEALKLDSYNFDDDMLQAQIKQWLGMGMVTMGTEQSDVEEFRLTTDGKLRFRLGESLYGAMGELASQLDGELDTERPFGDSGLTAEAILHFNTAALEEIELPGKQNLVGSEKNKPGIFLELTLQANFPPGSSDTEQELFDGLMILMAHE